MKETRATAAQLEAYFQSLSRLSLTATQRTTVAGAIDELKRLEPKSEVSHKAPPALGRTPTQWPMSTLSGLAVAILIAVGGLSTAVWYSTSDSSGLDIIGGAGYLELAEGGEDKQLETDRERKPSDISKASTRVGRGKFAETGDGTFGKRVEDTRFTTVQLPTFGPLATKLLDEPRSMGEPNGATSDRTASGRRTIDTAQIQLHVEDIDTIHDELPKLLVRFNSQVADTQLNGAVGTPRSANWVIRVPVKQLQEFLDEARQLAKCNTFTSNPRKSPLSMSMSKRD